MDCKVPNIKVIAVSSTVDKMTDEQRAYITHYFQGVDVSELGRLAVRKTNDGTIYSIGGVTTFRGLRYDGPDLQ